MSSTSLDTLQAFFTMHNGYLSAARRDALRRHFDAVLAETGRSALPARAIAPERLDELLGRVRTGLDPSKPCYCGTPDESVCPLCHDIEDGRRALDELEAFVRTLTEAP